MSGGGGIIIISGKKADGSDAGGNSSSAQAIKILWDSIPESAKTGVTWSQVETIINNALS
jgi:hypothetical protein